MTDLEKLYRGIAILLKYGATDFYAMGDVVYFYDAKQVSDDDSAALMALGFVYDGDSRKWSRL